LINVSVGTVVVVVGDRVVVVLVVVGDEVAAATAVVWATLVVTGFDTVVGAVLPPSLQAATSRVEKPIAINRFIVGTHRNQSARTAQTAVRPSSLPAARSSPSEMHSDHRRAERRAARHSDRSATT
jgi:hypothetical protein